MNVLQKLEYDHDKIVKLIQDIENLGHTKSQLRKPLFHLLKKQVLILNEAEEHTFYAELEKNFKTRKLVTTLQKQNQQIKQLIERLNKDELNSKEWHKDFDAFKNAVINHINMEENSLFPAADKVLSQSQEEHIGEELQEDKQQLWDVSAKGGHTSLSEDFIEKTHIQTSHAA